MPAISNNHMNRTEDCKRLWWYNIMDLNWQNAMFIQRQTNPCNNVKVSPELNGTYLC